MNALIVGKRRMGKSTLALALARLHSNLTIVYDPNTQFREFGAPRSIAEIEATVKFFSEGPDDQPPPEQPVILVYRPRVGLFHEDFTALANMLWQWDGYSFVVDEAPTLQTPHAINDELGRLVRQGPAGVSIFQTCHRVPDVNRLSRALCTDYFFFRSTQQKDVGNMADEFDDRLERILPSLKPYEVVHHWQGKGGTDEISIWRDSRPWFIELGHGETESQFGGQSADEAEPETLATAYDDAMTTPPGSDKTYLALKEGA